MDSENKSGKLPDDFGEIPCIAIIGDVVESRRFAPLERSLLQDALENAMTEVNKKHKTAILSKFAVTIGDEFQGLLIDPTCIITLIHTLPKSINDQISNQSNNHQVKLRFGIGYGTLTTRLRNIAIGMDGPAFHNARDALRDAKSENVITGLFRGFNDFDNELDKLTAEFFNKNSGIADNSSQKPSKLNPDLITPKNSEALKLFDILHKFDCCEQWQ